MSDVILEFIEPFREHAEDDLSLKGLIGCGITVWNLSLLPKSDRENLIPQVVSELWSSQRPRSTADPAGLQPETATRKPDVPEGANLVDMCGIEEILRAMIERRLEHFAQYRRFIVDYKITATGDGLHLLVASTPMDPE
jgi:hypothetical protein